MKNVLIDKLIKKINVELYSIEKSNANSTLVKNRLSKGNIIVVRNNPCFELLNNIYLYQTNYEKILWLYNSNDIIKTAKTVNSLTKREIILPVEIANITDTAQLQ